MFPLVSAIRVPALLLLAKPSRGYFIADSTLKLSRPADRDHRYNPNTVQTNTLAVESPNLAATIHDDPENYQEFLAHARAAEEDRLARAERPGGFESPVSAPEDLAVAVVPALSEIAPLKFSRLSNVLFYGLLMLAISLAISFVTALVFTILDIRHFGAQAGHIIWLVLSITFGVITTVLWLLNNTMRKDEKSRHREEQAIKLTAARRRDTHRLLHQARDRRIQRGALERAARRSLHSAQESERDVRVLQDALSVHGVPNPIADTDDNLPTPTHWEDDPYPMTEEEQQERRQAREDLIMARRMKEVERAVIAGPSTTRTATTAPAGREQARRAEIEFNRARLSRSRENVGGWIAGQTAADEIEELPATPVEPTTKPSTIHHPVKESGGATPDTRAARNLFAPPRLFKKGNGNESSTG